MSTNNAVNYKPTQHNVIIGSTNGNISNVAPSATSGVALISQGASSDPVFGTVTVPGGGTGAATLTGVLTGNGTSAITASAVTQYGTVIAGASNAVSSVAPSATSGVPYISQGSSANPVFGTAVVAGGGTGSTTFNTYGVVTTGSTSTTALSSVSLSSGQIVIGGTTTPAAGTITAGTNISISNGNNSITISATGVGGFSWVDQTSGTVTMAINTGYIVDNGASLVTLTLPATAAQGSLFEVAGKSAGGWVVAQASGQTIEFGTSATTTGTGGSLASTNTYDCVRLLCVTANTTFVVLSSVGNLTVV